MKGEAKTHGKVLEYTNVNYRIEVFKEVRPTSIINECTFDMKFPSSSIVPLFSVSRRDVSRCEKKR